MHAYTRSVSGILATVAAAALLAACGGSDGSTEQTGFLNLGVTDAPVDFADEVVVQFTGVELKPRGGPAFSIDFAPESPNLLELQGANRVLLLDGEEVPAGAYEWLRLKVNADPNVGGDSYLRLVAGGEQCELRIPSGDETGLKLVRGFTVGVGATSDFTIDFDLRKSIVAPPGQATPVNTCGNQAFLLKPALRIVDNLQVGMVSGSVDGGLIGTACASPNAAPYPGNVYLFGPVPDGETLVPDDYDGVVDDDNGDDPIASARVDKDTFKYEFGFVPAGKTYLVAYTCDLDETGVDADAPVTPPATGETVVFTPPEGKLAPVTANQAVEVNF
jgi:hypothetical protein